MYKFMTFFIYKYCICKIMYYNVTVETQTYVTPIFSTVCFPTTRGEWEVLVFKFFSDHTVKLLSHTTYVMVSNSIANKVCLNKCCN
jgi:hypothetical protein